MKRWICILIALAVLVSMMAAACAEEEDAASKELYELEHLHYIDTDEYINGIMAVPGGEAGLIADSFEDSRLKDMFRAWRGVDFALDIVGAKDISAKDPVHFVVEALVLQTLNSDQVRESMDLELSESIQDLLDHTSKLLNDLNMKLLEDMKISGSPGQLEELSMALTAAAKLLKSAGALSDDTQKIKALAESLEKLDGAFKEFHKNKELQKYAGALGLAIDGVNHLAEGGREFYSEKITTKVLFNAYMSATEEWEEFWRLVAMEAAMRADRFNLLSRDGDIATEIEKVLDEFHQARDPEKALEAMKKHAASRNGKIALKNGTELICDVVYDVLPAGSDAKVIMLLTKATQGAINAALNMDDVSISGLMAYVSAELTSCASFALGLAETELRANVDYEHAVRFDAMFHFYKTLMCQTLKYMIEYDRHITKAGMHGVVDVHRRVFEAYMTVRFLHEPQKHFNKKMELEMLASMLAAWEVRECHNIERQLVVIAKNLDLWNPLDDPDAFAQYFQYGVTDMDGDGLLEILATWVYGNGWASLVKLYEVNEAMDGLEAREVGKSDFMPDFARESAIPLYEKNGKYHMVFSDYDRVGWEFNATSIVLACLEGDGLKLEKLGTAETTNREDGSSDTEYFNAKGKSISKKKFRALPSEKYENCPEGKMTFTWITYEDGQNVLGGLWESWKGFGREAF